MQQLPQSLRRTSLFLGAALALTFLAGCGDVTFVHGTPGAPGPDTYVELEPNDSPWFPDFVTVVNADSFLTVDGHVEAIGFDIVDHIEFEASEPVEIEFFLEAFGPYGDVDVSIYDPIAGVILATYAIGGAFESGTIIVHDPGRPFQFVIEAYTDDSPWTLELVCYPHVCSCLTSGLSELAADDASNEDAVDADVLRAGTQPAEKLRAIEILVGS